MSCATPAADGAAAAQVTLHNRLGSSAEQAAVLLGQTFPNFTRSPAANVARYVELASAGDDVTTLALLEGLLGAEVFAEMQRAAAARRGGKAAPKRSASAGAASEAQKGSAGQEKSKAGGKPAKRGAGGGGASLGGGKKTRSSGPGGEQLSLA